ncbi:RNA-directed DNA polymerase [Methylophilus flavus]|uniref:RNA-directed DNA polymerase n=1 Tax=Methylophilus flavus TaxID=640084 RepID=A0ABW3P8H8_9PROT
MNELPQNLIEIAYKKLKQMIYYEKNHLFLRERLAEFECGNDFASRLADLNRVITMNDPSSSEKFRSWLADIEFALLPKGIKTDDIPNQEEGTFVTNVTSQTNYTIEKVNYIFNGPIELHLISVLWLMIQGPKLDSTLSENCMGSRLHPLVGNEDDYSAHLFKKYHELYSKWRDDGVKKARDLLIEEGRSVCIIALDIQEFYYRVQIDWEKLEQKLKRTRHSIETNNALYNHIYERENLGERLFECVRSICYFYQDLISEKLSITHPDIPDTTIGLPIGLCASPLIANWHLQEFDDAILNKVRPAYYGRYVDDIFLVITSESQFASKKDPIKFILKEVLVNNQILHWHEDKNRYELCLKPGLFLQRKKCIVQFFDSSHSIAGLEKFKKEIEENASDFAMLPVEGDDSPVEQVAYDLLYDGSSNKLRNVKEIAENRWDLAKHLTKQTQLYLLASNPASSQTQIELFRFFKGKNAIAYWDMWERVIAFFVISENIGAAFDFTQLITAEIKKIRSIENNVTRLLRNTLLEHLRISYEICLAVKFPDNKFMTYNSTNNKWRLSNLIRHHLVSVPLLNYTTFNGDLTSPKEVIEVELNYESISLSPRFIHFDECLGFINSGFSAETENDWISEADKLYDLFHGSKIEDVRIEITDTLGE